MELRSARTRVRRFAKRGLYDRATVDRILDEGLICHLAFVHDHQPFAIPTAYARVGDDLYLHGSSASRALRLLDAGVRVCVTVTITDGIVLARTAFNHSFNYRSAMILGVATLISDPAEKELALSRFTDSLVPGRWADVRKPTALELRATSILRLPISEASAKIRTGPPGDEGTDLETKTWAGVLPLELRALPAVPDPKLSELLPVPPYLANYARPHG